ncbi:MAG: divergent PAP2 family protein [Parcubacteria group bacterium]
MYLILITPIIAAGLAQLIKQFTVKKHRFKFKNFFAYSGMPSGHSSVVVSLATIIALQEGLDSPVFAMSTVLAILIITDAIGLRSYLGNHGKILNVLVKDLDEDEFLDKKYPILVEKIGHTPLQVLAGSVLGFAVSLVAWFIFSV